MKAKEMSRTSKVKYPSRWTCGLKIMKNWEPFVSGPLFAIERRPAPSCRSIKFSSTKRQHKFYG
jgi:hypothetical protein